VCTVSTIDEKAAAVAQLLDGATVGCAESCTAGRVAQVLASVPDAADWLRGSVVAYQLEIKRRYLGVSAESMYSERCAAEMAVGAAQFFGSDVAVSTTGVVGTEAQDGVSPGTVFIGTYVYGELGIRQHHFDVAGDVACERFAEQAIDDLLVHLRSGKLDDTAMRI
jgi:PncC family amidohydrolase